MFNHVWLDGYREWDPLCTGVMRTSGHAHIKYGCIFRLYVCTYLMLIGVCTSIAELDEVAAPAHPLGRKQVAAAIFINTQITRRYVY